MSWRTHAERLDPPSEAAGVAPVVKHYQAQDGSVARELAAEREFE